jgi:hypothetical protein
VLCISWKFGVLGMSPFIVFIMICALEILESDDYRYHDMLLLGWLFLSGTILIVSSRAGVTGKEVSS